MPAPSNDPMAPQFSQSQLPSPTRATRSLTYADVARNRTSSPPRSYAQALASGVSERKACEHQCGEKPCRTDFFGDVDFPALETRPSWPSRRFSSWSSHEVHIPRTDTLTFRARQAPHQRPLLGRSFSSSFTEKCPSKKTPLPRRSDRAPPRACRSETQMSTKPAKKKKSKARCPVASPPWEPLPTVRSAAETVFLAWRQRGRDSRAFPSHYQHFMDETAGLLEQARTFELQLDSEFHSLSDPARLSLTNQKVTVEEHYWAFDVNEFLQFSQSESPGLFWSPCSVAGRGFYDPLTSKLEEEWPHQCVPSF